MEFTIEGDFDANELRAALEQTVSLADGAEFRLVRGRSQTRVVTGLEPAALLAILKGVTTVTPLVVALVRWLLSKGKTEGKPKTLKIVAADDSVLSVPEDTSAESLGALLEHQPKFKNPKLVVIE